MARLKIISDGSIKRLAVDVVQSNDFEFAAQTIVFCKEFSRECARYLRYCSYIKRFLTRSYGWRYVAGVSGIVPVSVTVAGVRLVYLPNGSWIV